MYDVSPEIPNIELFVTADGSHSLQFSERPITYHSRHGAILESQHIFIEAGLKHLPQSKNTISIFEMGFGSGLNALLTLMAMESENSSLYYETIDTLPLPHPIYSSLNYCHLLQRQDLHNAFQQMHSCSWNQPVQVSSAFTLHKRLGDMRTIELSASFDLVFFDAFDPVTQPQLWTAAIFSKIREHLNPNGLLLTYSSKVTVQNALRDAGFTVEKIPGPRGKREVLRATAI